MNSLLLLASFLASLLPWCLCQAGSGSQTVTFTMRKMAFSTNQFGIDLYRALNVTDENVALCPFCIGSSLAMVLLGAEGSTAMALRQALYLWGLHPQEVHLAYHDLIAHLGLNLTPSGRGVPRCQEIPRRRQCPEEIIDNIYIQRHFAVHFPYQFLLNRYYNTSVYPLDFVMNAEQSTRYINLFFERNTEGRVPHILSQVPSPSTNLLLLSAIYFRGTLDMNMAQVEESRFVGRAGR
ncbi:leukocyte elastase inhibitor A [Caerostris extrusa]|uniref:Leukocyte elastase inhibitor A n=1 Tax=Caerostris extrusa TaxID=172846 RepID=A0AAV4WLL8_CAEEX|nr:leukocyte elastase inhibitor A [Caerostris extrusa]